MLIKNALKSVELYLPMPNGRYLVLKNTTYGVRLLVIIAWLLLWLLSFCWLYSNEYYKVFTIL